MKFCFNTFREFLLFTSNLDEIPKYSFVQALASCKLPTPFVPLVLMCHFYFYSFEFRSRSYNLGIRVSRHQAKDVILTGTKEDPNLYRKVKDACYHCTYCFDRLAAVREKIGSFSHMELDIPKYHGQKHIIDHFRNGKDLYDRLDNKYPRVSVKKTELPRLLRSEPTRFMYMLDRSPPNARFRDV